MIDKIVDGISMKLKNVFGAGYKIYPEAVEQGLKEPCFFIQLLEPNSTKMLGDQHRREYPFCVQHLPEDKGNSNSECYKTLDELYIALEYISIDGNLVRGVGMRGSVNDGILSFFVNYNVSLRKVSEYEPMEVLQQQPTKIR